MGLQAIIMMGRSREPVVLVDQNRGMTGGVRGSQQLDRSRGTNSFGSLVPACVASCVLCSFIGVLPNKAAYAESKTGAAPTQKERKVPQPNALSGVERKEDGQK